MKKLYKILLILILFILIGCSSQIIIDRALKINQDDWITLGGSNSRTNITNEVLKLPFTKLWDYQGPAGISSNQPLLADSILFVGFMNGELYAINLKNGKRIGRIKVDAAIHGAPCLSKNVLYIPIAQHKYSLRAYNINEGYLIWKKEIEGIESSLLLSDQYLYAVTENGTIYCIKPIDGKTIWDYKLPKKSYSSLAADSSKLYVGCDDGFLYCINKNNGKLLWKFYTSSPIRSTPLVGKEGNIYFGSSDSNFYSVSADSGFMNWKFNSNSPIISGSSSNDSKIYFGNLSGYFYCLDKLTGNLRWSFKTKGNIISSPILTKEHVAFSSYDKNIYVLNKNSGELFWSIELDGRPKTTPIFWNNYMIICYEDYDIEAYKY